MVSPDVAFHGSNPLLLTTIGEFVVKNVVLMAAGLAVTHECRALGTVIFT
jgi:putative oxidoreductase